MIGERLSQGCMVFQVIELCMTQMLNIGEGIPQGGIDGTTTEHNRSRVRSPPTDDDRDPYRVGGADGGYLPQDRIQVLTPNNSFSFELQGHKSDKPENSEKRIY